MSIQLADPNPDIVSQTINNYLIQTNAQMQLNTLQYVQILNNTSMQNSKVIEIFEICLLKTSINIKQLLEIDNVNQVGQIVNIYFKQTQNRIILSDDDNYKQLNHLYQYDLSSTIFIINCSSKQHLNNLFVKFKIFLEFNVSINVSKYINTIFYCSFKQIQELTKSRIFYHVEQEATQFQNFLKQIYVNQKLPYIQIIYKQIILQQQYDFEEFHVNLENITLNQLQLQNVIQILNKYKLFLFLLNTDQTQVCNVQQYSIKMGFLNGDNQKLIIQQNQTKAITLNQQLQNQLNKNNDILKSKQQQDYDQKTQDEEFINIQQLSNIIFAISQKYIDTIDTNFILTLYKYMTNNFHEKICQTIQLLYSFKQNQFYLLIKVEIDNGQCYLIICDNFLVLSKQVAQTLLAQQLSSFYNTVQVNLTNFNLIFDNYIDDHNICKLNYFNYLLNQIQLQQLQIADNIEQNQNLERFTQNATNKTACEQMQNIFIIVNHDICSMADIVDQIQQHIQRNSKIDQFYLVNQSPINMQNYTDELQKNLFEFVQQIQYSHGIYCIKIATQKQDIDYLHKINKKEESQCNIDLIKQYILQQICFQQYQQSLLQKTINQFYQNVIDNKFLISNLNSCDCIILVKLLNYLQGQSKEQDFMKVEVKEQHCLKDNQFYFINDILNYELLTITQSNSLQLVLQNKELSKDQINLQFNQYLLQKYDLNSNLLYNEQQLIKNLDISLILRKQFSKDDVNKQVSDLQQEVINFTQQITDLNCNSKILNTILYLLLTLQYNKFSQVNDIMALLKQSQFSDYDQISKLLKFIMDYFNITSYVITINNEIINIIKINDNQYALINFQLLYTVKQYLFNKSHIHYQVNYDETAIKDQNISTLHKLVLVLCQLNYQLICASNQINLEYLIQIDNRQQFEHIFSINELQNTKQDAIQFYNSYKFCVFENDTYFENTMFKQLLQQEIAENICFIEYGKLIVIV